jgi:hypothetical protein
MFTVAASIQIDRPMSDVYRYTTDYANDVRWRKGVIAMSSVPPGAAVTGAVKTETMSIFGRDSVTVTELTEVTERHAAFKHVSGPIPCAGFRSVAPTPGGTAFTYSLTISPVGLIRMLEPFVRPMLQRQVNADLVRLKQVLEAG